MNKKTSYMQGNKFTMLVIVIGICVSIIFSAFVSTENTPPGTTGSPKDEKDCASCHKAKAKTIEGIISSNCENKTYVPLKTYTINIKLKGTEKAKKFGFQVSPQTATGKLQGKLTITDPVQTKLAALKYVNHTGKGVDGSGEKTWSFDWTAPAKGSGTVNFYGSFVIGGKPETVYNSTLTLQEKN